jgi:C1A family cysteine protease
MFRLALASTAVASALKVWDQEWEDFKALYKKEYKDDDDENDRYNLYQVFKARVAELNALQGEAGDAFGITWAADLKDGEGFQRGLKKPQDFVATAPLYQKKYARRSPTSINWRDTEAITAIKNQGQCGSCWAFSATEAIESQLVLSTGSSFALELSPQQITSCVPSTGSYGCLGCNGGFTEGAYEYLKNGTFLANSFYIPYQQSLTESTATVSCPTAQVEAIDGPMQVLSGGYAQVTGYTYATPACTSGACDNQDLDALAASLEETPVSVCVNAGAWNAYTGGVMTSAACGSMAADYQDHCVMATGFNATAPTPYWIVRNSWSDTWGEEGYIYLEMAENTCGLADDATIPTVAYDGDSAKVAANFEHHYLKATGGAPSTTLV